MSGSWGQDLHWHPYDSKSERRRYQRRQKKAASSCTPNDQTEPVSEALCCAIPFRTLAELVTEFKQRLCERKKAKAALTTTEPVNQVFPPDSREHSQSDQTLLEDCDFELIPIAGLHTAIDPAQSNRTFITAQQMGTGNTQACSRPVTEIPSWRVCSYQMSEPRPSSSNTNNNKVRPRGHCCYCGVAAFIPYAECNFCGEKPSYHHGRCCPNRPAQPTLSSADKKLGKAQHIDSLLTQEPLSEIDTQILTASPPSGLSYRRKERQLRLMIGEGEEEEQEAKSYGEDDEQ
jgi:hypothetical protein